MRYRALTNKKPSIDPRLQLEEGTELYCNISSAIWADYFGLSFTKQPKRLKPPTHKGKQSNKLGAYTRTRNISRHDFQNHCGQFSNLKLPHCNTQCITAPSKAATHTLTAVTSACDSQRKCCGLSTSLGGSKQSWRQFLHQNRSRRNQDSGS
jgi:hypothetical protein